MVSCAAELCAAELCCCARLTPARPPLHFVGADLTGISTLDISFELGEPFKPFDQLMGVFPAASAHALPAGYQVCVLGCGRHPGAGAGACAGKPGCGVWATPGDLHWLAVLLSTSSQSPSKATFDLLLAFYPTNPCFPTPPFHRQSCCSPCSLPRTPPSSTSTPPPSRWT